MTDTAPPPASPEEPYYTETVVEYVDNKRQRAILGVLLVVLFLLLVAASYAIYRLTPGRGAPTGEGDLPRGITWIRSIYGWGNAPEQQLSSPTDVAIAKDGTIWVVSGHGTIAGFNPDGSVKKIIKPKNAGSIEGIAVGDNGNIYVSDFAGQILEFTPQGQYVELWRVELAEGLDVRDGKIAVAAAKGIAVFTENNSKVVVQAGGVRGWGKDQFDLPHAVLLGPDGKIYVTDTQNRRIKALTPTGRPLWILGEAPDRSKPGVADVRSQGASMAAAPFMLPSGLTMDGNGRLVIVDPFKFRITAVDAKAGKVAREPGKNGKQGRLANYGEQGQSDGFFNYPTGIDYDKTRDWFAVADTANNRVQIVRIPGSGGSILAPLVGAFRLPMCIFCIPFILLLIALALSIARRRRELQPQEEEPGASEEPDSTSFAEVVESSE